MNRRLLLISAALLGVAASAFGQTNILDQTKLYNMPIGLNTIPTSTSGQSYIPASSISSGSGYGNFISAFNLPVTGCSSLSSDIALYGHDSYGGYWTDSNGVLLKNSDGSVSASTYLGTNGSAGTPVPAGQTFAPPTGAAFLSVFIQTSDDGSGQGYGQPKNWHLTCTAGSTTPTNPTPPAGTTSILDQTKLYGIPIGLGSIPTSTSGQSYIPYSSISSGSGYGSFISTISLPITGCATLTSTLPLYGHSGYGGYWTDSGGNILRNSDNSVNPATYLGSGGAAGTPIPANQTITPPAGAAFLSAFIQTSDDGSGQGFGQPKNWYMYCAAPSLPAPTISFSIANHAYSDAAFGVAAMSNSAGAITYALVSGPATLSGSTVSLSGSNGTVVVRATQAATSTYAAATANASFLVSGAPITGAAFSQISWSNIGNGFGSPLADGAACFTPVSAASIPITATYSAAGLTGTITKTSACGSVTNGTLQAGIQLVRSNVTNPINLTYMVTLTDNSTGMLIVRPTDGYRIQPTGNTLEVSTVPPLITGPASYIVGTAGAPGESAYQIWLDAGNTGTQAQFLASLVGTSSSAVANPTLGKKFVLFCDSICSIRPDDVTGTGVEPLSGPLVASLGSSLLYKSSYPGRPMAGIFADWTNGVDNPGSNADPDHAVGGVTLTQMLSGADYAMVFLGTNDRATAGVNGWYPNGYSLGNPTSDTSSSLTFVGYMKKAVETILARKPGIRLFFVTPYLSDDGGYTDTAVPGMIRTVAAQYGLPVISLDQLSGFNSATWHTYLLYGDPPNWTNTENGLHPNTTNGYPALVKLLTNQIRTF